MKITHVGTLEDEYLQKANEPKEYYFSSKIIIGRNEHGYFKYQKYIDENNFTFLKLDYPGISLFHARLTQDEENSWWIEDLGTANWVWIVTDSQKLPQLSWSNLFRSKPNNPSILKSEDHFILCDHVFRFDIS